MIILTTEMRKGMKEDIPVGAIIAIARILLPQGGTEDDMLKVLGIAHKVAYAISMEDSIWLIEKAMERLEKGEPTENNNI